MLNRKSVGLPLTADSTHVTTAPTGTVTGEPSVRSCGVVVTAIASQPVTGVPSIRSEAVRVPVVVWIA